MRLEQPAKWTIETLLYALNRGRIGLRALSAALP